MAFRDEYAHPGRTGDETKGQAGTAPGQGGPTAEATPAAAGPDRPAAPRADGAVPAKARPLRKLVLLLVAASALGYGAFKGYDWYADGRFIVSTDDAYVQADLTLLAAKVSGYVASVEVANNQAVKAGDVIARLDDGDYRLALQAAKDKLATQEAAVARVGRQAEAAKASVAQAAAQVDAARADFTRAAADYARQQQLATQDYSTRARLEQSKADRDRTEAAVKSAEAALAAQRANVEVLQAQAQEAARGADELKTAVARAERDLSFTVVRAPVDGVVGNKAFDVGTYVQPGTRLAALVPLDHVHIDANFKETQLGGVRVGQRVRIEVDALKDREITGTVESVAPASGSVFSLLPPENATGNFTKIVQRVPVRVRVDDAVAHEGVLRPGLSAVVSVDSREQPDPAAVKTAQR